nr:hypothetical protein [Candidatus Entotheonella palauensis]
MSIAATALILSTKVSQLNSGPSGATQAGARLFCGNPKIGGLLETMAYIWDLEPTISIVSRFGAITSILKPLIQIVIGIIGQEPMTIKPRGKGSTAIVNPQ